jgi:hypothetical protein
MACKSLGPAFILSSERSGSTLCRYILDTHPNIGCPGELTLGELCASLARVLGRLDPASGESDHLSAEVCAKIRCIVDSIMESYLRRVRKTVWCEKSPANLQFLPMLHRTFPDARYICLYRAFRDSAHSCLSVSQLGFAWGLREYVARYPGNLVLAMAESWADKTEKLLAFESENGDQCLRVRYEELVSEPGREMARVFDFLGQSWDPSILETALRMPHDEGGGDTRIRIETRIHKRSVGAGRDLPTWMVPPAILGRINQLSTLLQYALI